MLKYRFEFLTDQELTETELDALYEAFDRAIGSVVTDAGYSLENLDPQGEED